MNDALPRRYLWGFFFCGGVSQNRGLPLHSVVFAEGLLRVSVRRCVAHRTLAAALGFGRCRHCEDVCSLVCRTTALDYLRFCRFLSDVPSQLRNICHFDAIDANIAPKHSQPLRRLMLLIIGWSGG